MFKIIYRVAFKIYDHTLKKPKKIFAVEIFVPWTDVPGQVELELPMVRWKRKKR